MTKPKTDFNDLAKLAGNDVVCMQMEAAAPVTDPTPQDAPGEANGEYIEEATPETVEQLRFTPRPFPFGIMPDGFMELVTEYSAALQVQPEVIAMGMLTVASATIGNSIILEIKKGWETSSFLWVTFWGDTGTGKSHSIEATSRPVKIQQSLEATRHKAVMDEYNNELSAYKADKKNSNPPNEPPPMRHYYTTNFTIESLIPMYQANARGLFIHIDEQAGLFKGLNQYKGNGNDQEQILSLFNASDIKVDRKGGGGYVRNSGAAVIGGMQRGILSQIFGDSDYINGTVYRFLPVIMEHTPPKFTTDCISDAAAQKWQDFVDWTYEIPMNTDSESGKILPLKLTLETAALEAWRVFHDRYAESEPFVSPKFRGYLPKLRTYCLKFMTILHVMECYRHDALATVVSQTTVDNAVLLTEYFAGQAIQLITTAAGEQNPYCPAIHKALESLQGEVVNGKLLLSQLRDRMNEMLPGDMQISATQNKRLSSWLKEIGMTVTTRSDNKSVVLIS